jgi:hypothetical protein
MAEAPAATSPESRAPQPEKGFNLPAGHRDGTAGAMTLDLALFLEHWRAIPKRDLVPTLADFLDRPHPTFQPWTQILDVEPAALPLRLVGTALVDLVGREITGLDHLSLFPEAIRVDALRRHHVIVRHPCGMHSVVPTKTVQGKELLLVGIGLPLRRKNGGHCVVRAIAVADTLGFGDAVAEFEPSIRDRAWIDLGAGVPDALQER